MNKIILLSLKLLLSEYFLTAPEKTLRQQATQICFPLLIKEVRSNLKSLHMGEQLNTGHVEENPASHQGQDHLRLPLPQCSTCLVLLCVPRSSLCLAAVKTTLLLPSPSVLSIIFLSLGTWSQSVPTRHTYQQHTQVVFRAPPNSVLGLTIGTFITM